MTTAIVLSVGFVALGILVMIWMEHKDSSQNARVRELEEALEEAVSQECPRCGAEDGDHTLKCKYGKLLRHTA